MALYTFHLDVTVPPGVAAARVRAAVAPMPPFGRRLSATWKGAPVSDLPFVGAVEGDTFRIRPNITHRNPFLPLVKGRIAATPSGARVNVVMFMHPVSLVVTLLWCGLLLWAEWSALDFSVGWSVLPVGLMLLGAAISLGVFYRDALKAMPQLTLAVLDPTIAADIEPPPVPPRAPRRLGRLAGMAGALAGGAVIVIALVIALAWSIAVEQRLRSSAALARAVDVASRSSEVQAALGTSITVGPLPSGVIVDGRRYGYAAITASLAGSKGKATLDAVSNRAGGGWTIQRAVVSARDGRKIDVTPPPVREAVRYPAAGRVYLLPFDAASSADVQELPRYFKARLDVDVTILPVEELPGDLADAKTHQLLSEKIVERIEEAHPDIAADFDASVLGVTSRDMNMQSWGQDYAVNFRSGRFGVVSTARLHNTRRLGRWNAEEYPVRVRKLVMKNLALLHFPVALMSDASSALAASVFTPDDVDAMGENFGGESGNAHSTDSSAPCLTILHRRAGGQSWRIGCTGEPPLDRGIDRFETWTAWSMFVMSHTDFPFDGHRPFTFVRKYRSASDVALAFGVGGNDSFDIAPLGDSKTFSEVELVFAAGDRIPYYRTSPGKDYQTAKLATRTYQGHPFSRSTMEWNAGWDVKTRDGWTYRFPSSGPGRTYQQSALVGIRSESGAAFTITRSGRGDLREVRAPGGGVVRVTDSDGHRIVSAADSSGRTLGYEYDPRGRLVHVRDPENGDEFYDYDKANQLTTVRDTARRPVLAIKYGHIGQILSQTLADGRRITYDYGYGEGRTLSDLTITLPDGYEIEWHNTSDGMLQSWPHLRSPAAHP